MKKLNQETKIILLFFFIGILMVVGVVYSAFNEQEFVETEFNKKVKRISSFRDLDCVYFTDETSMMFQKSSIVKENDTLMNMRLINFVNVGDSLIKHKNEVFIRCK